MSIIEKLGIAPFKTYFYIADGDYCDPQEVRELEQQRNEMLEALIIHASMEVSKGGIFPVLAVMVEATRELIEKTTGKKWEEIKQIVDKENTCLK